MYRPSVDTERDGRGRFIRVWKGRDFEEVNYAELKRGAIRGGHHHRRNRELILVVKGRVRLEVVNVEQGAGRPEVHELRQGDCVVIEPYDRHTFAAITDAALVTCNTLAPYDQDPPDVFED